MAERMFEGRLERLFAESPGFADAELFALQIIDRLERAWLTRRLTIASLGTLGGLIGAYQVLASGIAPVAGRLYSEAHATLQTAAARLSEDVGLPEGFHFDGQILWMSAALAAMAVGLTLARNVRVY
jgi:hypothetical protein